MKLRQAKKLAKKNSAKNGAGQIAYACWWNLKRSTRAKALARLRGRS